jgi:hypothetical protein
MDVKHSGLLTKLCAMNVIDQRDKEELESIVNSIWRKERLLSMLSKTSADQWKQFLVALDSTGQRYLANMIRGKDAEDFPGFVIIYFLVHRHQSRIIEHRYLQHKTAQAHTLRVLKALAEGIH